MSVELCYIGNNTLVRVHFTLLEILYFDIDVDIITMVTIYGMYSAINPIHVLIYEHKTCCKIYQLLLFVIILEYRNTVKFN